MRLRTKLSRLDENIEIKRIEMNGILRSVGNNVSGGSVGER